MDFSTRLFWALGILFFGLFPKQLYGQTLIVRNAQSQETLAQVAVFTPDKSHYTLTNSLGVASLEGFATKTWLRFQLLGFEDLNVYWEGESLLEVGLQPQTENLEEVILSVARSANKRRALAEKVSVIQGQMIRENRTGTAAELLQRAPGVRIQKSQGGGGSPVIRGFEANRILLVVDGVRMNNAIYRSGHLQNAITIDPNILERVEIVYGSSSVGYGSDALGGVVHYYTKSPRIGSEASVQSSWNSSFNSANSAWVQHASVETNQERWGSYSALTYSSFGDIRMGKNRFHDYADWGKNFEYSENNREIYAAQATTNEDPNLQKHTGYSQWDFFHKLVYQKNERQQWGLNFQFSRSSDIDRYDKLNEYSGEELKFSEWFYGPQMRFLVAPRVEFYPQKRWMDHGKVILAYQYVEESRNSRRFNSLNRKSQEETVYVWSLNADFETQKQEGQKWSYGTEILYNQIQSIAYERELQVNNNRIESLGIRFPVPTRYPSDGSSYTSFAVYLNWIYELSEKLTLNAGSRLTFTSIAAQWDDVAQISSSLSQVELASEALTNTVAVTYRPTLKWQWNTLFSNGFRSPNIDDIGKIRESNGQLIVPNDFLKPEYAYTVESSLRFNSLDRNFYAAVNVFGTLVSRHIVRSDYIIFSDTSTEDPNTILYNGEEVNTIANKNLGNRRIYGGSFDMRYNLNQQWKSQTSLTYTSAFNHVQYGPMPSISPFFGYWDLSYEKHAYMATLRVDFSAAKDPKDYSLGGEDGLEETPLIDPEATNLRQRYAGMPAWQDWSLVGRYRPSERLEIHMGVTNILDAHYRTFASGISAPGRSLRLGIDLKF